MDPYGYFDEKCSQRGYPNTYPEESYSSYGVPPSSYPSPSSPYFYGENSTPQGYGPSYSLQTPHAGYSHGTPDYEASFYPPPPDYRSTPSDYYEPSPPPDPYQAISVNVQEAYASLNSTVEEFNSWEIIPIPSTLYTAITQLDSSVEAFFELDSSQVQLMRYGSLAGGIMRVSVRIEAELRGMVDQFIFLKNDGLAPFYDGTQPLETSEDMYDLVVRRIPRPDELSLLHTMPISSPVRDSPICTFENLCEEETCILENGVGDFPSEVTCENSFDDGEPSGVHDRVDIFEEDEPEEITEHDDDAFVIPELPPSNDSTTGVGCKFEAVPIENNSTCSTDIFIYPEVDHAASLRKELILFLGSVDDRARRHKNFATRDAYSRLSANVPSLPILESTKAWYERHFFLDPG